MLSRVKPRRRYAPILQALPDAVKLRSPAAGPWACPLDAPCRGGDACFFVTRFVLHTVFPSVLCLCPATRRTENTAGTVPAAPAAIRMRMPPDRSRRRCWCAWKRGRYPVDRASMPRAAWEGRTGAVAARKSCPAPDRMRRPGFTWRDSRDAGRRGGVGSGLASIPAPSGPPTRGPRRALNAVQGGTSHRTFSPDLFYLLGARVTLFSG